MTEEKKKFIQTKLGQPQVPIVTVTAPLSCRVNIERVGSGSPLVARIEGNGRVPLAEDRGLVSPKIPRRQTLTLITRNPVLDGGGRHQRLGGQLFPERTGAVSVDPGHSSRPWVKAKG